MIDAATREPIDVADGSYECVIGGRSLAVHRFCLTEDRIAEHQIVTLPLASIRAAVADPTATVYVRWKAGCFWRVTDADR